MLWPLTYLAAVLASHCMKEGWPGVILVTLPPHKLIQVAWQCIFVGDVPFPEKCFQAAKVALGMVSVHTIFAHKPR